jgi:lipid II:glycine glycyltransferase (peptidoglycan interpeptide bridge formation enzyme)
MDVLLERTDVDSLLGPNLLQSGFWCRFKEGFGWKPFAFRSRLREIGREWEFPLYVQVREVAPSFHLAYIPHGPEDPAQAGWNRSQVLELLAEELHRVLPRYCRVLRFDFPWEDESFSEATCSERARSKPAPSFCKAPLDVQPPDTVLLDLSLGEEELLEGMKPKTRYNVRLAERKGVRVKTGGTGDIEKWYSLYEGTAQRDRIGIHPYRYYKRLFELSETYEGFAPKLNLLLAYVEDTLVSGIIVAVYKDQGVYLYGASSNAYRNYMASYCLQWEGIRWANAQGALQYDLYGIPPRDDPHHPMHGLYRFKTGFGGRIVHRPGSWDYPFSKSMYLLYRKAEGLRGWFYKTVRKRFP